MSPSDLVSDIREFCEENANPAIVEKYAGNLENGYDAYGLSLEQIEDTVMSILEGGAGYKLIQQTCRILVRSKKYEETSFAILLTKAFEKDFTAKAFEDLEFWFLFGIRNWTHADVISVELIYPMLKSKLISINNLEPWRTAGNKYQRRAVPVSLIKLMKTSKVLQPYFELLSPLMADKEPEVKQGLESFFKEAVKINKNETENFLSAFKTPKNAKQKKDKPPK
jgi:hypothetical protein